MKLRTRLNISYAAVQGIFWIVCCPVVGFGSAYLLERGFSSARIGIMLGVANILALVIQPVLSARSDADPAFSPVRIVMGLAAAMLASSAVQLALMPQGLAMAVLWTFSAACAIAANVFVTAVKYQIDQDGAIDFGACRAVGSLSWGCLSAGLGFAIERFGMRVVPLVTSVASVGFLVLLAYCGRMAGGQGRETYLRDREEAGAASTWGAFIRANPWLMGLLLGIGLVYMHHALANYFSMVLVENVGGDNSDMGLIVALAAVLEIPGMVAFSHMEGRFGAERILLFALAMFTVKSVAIWLAADVAQLTGAFALQLFSYGFFTTSTVAFAARAVRPCDLVKAQACFTLVTTVSAIVSSVAGGELFHAMGTGATLLAVAVLAVAGLMVSAFAMARIARRG